LCSDPKGSTPQKGQLQPNASVLISHPELVNFLLSEELPEETSMRSIRSNLPEENSMRSIRSNLPEETSMRSIRSEEPRCCKFVDFRKLVLKNEYTVVRYFNNNSDLMMYLERKSIYMVCKKSQPVQCTLTDCNTPDCHKMQMKYYSFLCSEECQLKLRAKHCLKSNEIKLAIGLIPHCYCRINGITIEDKKPRGMCEITSIDDVNKMNHFVFLIFM
jgi:hypothetical protein